MLLRGQKQNPAQELSINGYVSMISFIINLILRKANISYLLGFPTTSLSEINRRLSIVEYFHHNTHLTGDIRQILQEVDDAQRTSQKISFDYCGPDDFIKLKR